MKKAFNWIWKVIKQVVFTAGYMIIFAGVSIVVAFQEAYKQAWQGESFVRNLNLKP